MYFITSKTSPANALISVLTTSDNRSAARAYAAQVGGTVRTNAEMFALLAANKVDVTTMPDYVAPAPAPAPTLVELATEIKATNKARRTIGKKEKALKRVVTPAAVIDAATIFAREQLNGSKVAYVKALAGWAIEVDGKTVRLQRRDLFAITKAVGYEIADATISTQFQIARSHRYGAVL